MVTFKKVLIKGKWYGEWDSFYHGKRTGITINQSEQGKGDEFYVLADQDSRYYQKWDSDSRKSLDAAKSMIKRFFERESNNQN